MGVVRIVLTRRQGGAILESIRRGVEQLGSSLGS